MFHRDENEVFNVFIFLLNDARAFNWLVNVQLTCYELLLAKVHEKTKICFIRDQHCNVTSKCLQ